MKEVSTTSTEKTPDRPRNDTTRPDRGGHPESSSTRELPASALGDMVRRGLQGILQNSDQRNSSQGKELPQTVKTSPENSPKSKWIGHTVKARNGKLYKEQPTEDKTVTSGFRNKAREIVGNWSRSQGKELSQDILQRDGNQSKQDLVNAEALLKELKEQRRGDKTVGGEALKEARAMVDEWIEDNQQRAHFIPPMSLINTFPAFRLIAELDKKIDRFEMELNVVVRHIPRGHFAKTSDPPTVPALIVSHYEASLIQMRKDRQRLKDSLPKNAKEHDDMRDDIHQEITNKIQNLISNWHTQNKPCAEQVTAWMVKCSFYESFWEATALEKTNTDMISARQSLQKAEEQLPQSPLEVIRKDAEMPARFRSIVAIAV